MFKIKICRQIGWNRALGLLLIIWLVFLLMAFTLLRHEGSDSQTSIRLNKAFKELQLLHQQRTEINQLLSVFQNGDSFLKEEDKEAFFKSLQERVVKADSLLDGANFVGDSYLITKEEPSLQYEKLRRRLKMGVNEMWYFINSQVKQILKHSKELPPNVISRLNHVLEEGVEHKRSMLKDVQTLGEIDGYASWRVKEAAVLSDLVQRRLRYLQNPKDCSTARKLICNLNKGCGYGCQLHHVVYCLVVAYGTERTLILKSKGWRYHRPGWEEVFKPVSDTCLDPSGSTVGNWPGSTNTQCVMLPIIDSISPRPPFLPLSVPLDLAPRIARLHGDPIVWWIGQFLKYLLRPQPATSALLQSSLDKFGFKKPIVGVHIRRTDKVGTEAAFHSLDEYMTVVEEYYKQLSLTTNVEVKRVYLASDDPKVFQEIKKKYPEYEALGDPSVAKGAAVATRYSDNSLNGIIMDIHFLSLCDYLVCTFSSQVCRVAYEIMQALHPDAADKFRSLDDIYYYGGQNIHRRVAILPHRASSADQMDLDIGDTIGVAGNHWDGYSKGRNLKSNKIGLYPSFKVEDLVETVEFPTYTEVPLEAPSGT
uniref:Alpha-(1,6)-fucosyltransferase n=1 Tax=Clastoptera arizonana TaxID=38151 RepID=A0A1B6CPN6_9HEMI